MKQGIRCLILLFAIIFALGSNANAQHIKSAGVSGKWSASATWIGGILPGPLDSVTIADADTVTIDTSATIANLVVGEGVSGVLYTIKTATVALTVNGDILIKTGALFKVQTNTTGGTGVAHTLTLTGSITNSGGTLDFRNGTSGTTLSVVNLILTGTTVSRLNVPYVSSTNGEFNYITINKTAPGKVVLGSNIITAGGSSTGLPAANSGLNFLSGIVETGNFMLAYQGTTSAQVSGASDSSYVIGNFGRGMSSTAGSSKTFYVGDSNGYRPFYLRSTTSGSSTGHLAIVKCVRANANTGTSSLAGGIDKVSAVRYYQVTYSNAIGGATSMTFDLVKPGYGANDGVVAGNTDLRVAYSVDSLATWNGITQTVSDTTALPKQITPDAFVSPIVLNSGSKFYVAIARATGTTENSLDAPVPVTTPSFEASSSSLNFGTVTVGQTKKDSVTVTNNGTASLEISAVTSSNTNFTVTPTTGSIAVAGSQKFYITFAPTSAGTQTGKIAFTHNASTHDTVTVTGSGVTTGVEFSENAIPKVYELHANFPNPFNPSTSILYGLPFQSKVELKVYSVLGQEVANLVDGVQEAGYHRITWNSQSNNNNQVASGVYFFRMSAQSTSKAGQWFTQVRKMILLK